MFISMAKEYFIVFLFPLIRVHLHCLEAKSHYARLIGSICLRDDRYHCWCLVRFKRLSPKRTIDFNQTGYLCTSDSKD